MKAVLLSVHVLASVILIGPITASASLFPRYVRAAASTDNPTSAPAWPVVAAMHRISSRYAIPAIAVPVFGIGLGAAMGVLTQTWLIVAMALTAVAAGLLVLRILPSQRTVMADLTTRNDVTGGVRQLAMQTGIFGLLWATVVVLMIVRPGSSTGV